MAEGQQYDPIIEAKMETQGIHKGRIIDKDLAHSLAETQNYVRQNSGNLRTVDVVAKKA